MNQTFVFSQGEHDLKFQPHGICATLSSYWIKLMRDEKSAGADHRSGQLRRAIRRFGPIVQKSYGTSVETADTYRQRYSGLLRFAGESRIDDVREWAGIPPGNELTDYVKEERKVGYLFSFWFSQGGHATAIWRSGHGGLLPSGHVYFFDPNFGEYKGNKGGFSQWIRRFLPHQYGTINSCRAIRVVKADEVVKFGQKVM